MTTKRMQAINKKETKNIKEMKITFTNNVKKREREKEKQIRIQIS